MQRESEEKENVESRDFNLGFLQLSLENTIPKVEETLKLKEPWRLCSNTVRITPVVRGSYELLDTIPSYVFHM